jgi:hypothetical protein
MKGLKKATKQQPESAESSPFRQLACVPVDAYRQKSPSATARR